MKFGEALKATWDACYKDIASEDKSDYYTHKHLMAAISLMPWSARNKVLAEFVVTAGVIHREILKCKHEEYSTPYVGHNECKKCGCVRDLELEDQDPNSYNERKVWSEWKTYFR